MYKCIDACINMNVYREKRVEEYLCRERERGRQANGAFSLQFLLCLINLSLAVFFIQSSNFGFFLGIDWFENFPLYCSLINIYRARKTTSRTNNNAVF